MYPVLAIYEHGITSVLQCKLVEYTIRIRARLHKSPECVAAFESPADGIVVV